MKSFPMASKIFITCILALAETFFVSCGLEDVITVNAPTSLINSPLYSGDDYLKWYASFRVNETDQPDSFSGTEIYYKIYNNSSDLISQRNSILSVNTSSNSTAAATRMVDTYQYQVLGAHSFKTGKTVSQSVFVPADILKNSLNVAFRVKTYTGNENYGANGEDVSDFEQFRACIKFSGRLRAFVNDSTVFVGYDSSEGWKYFSGASGGSGTAVAYNDIDFIVPARNNRKSFDFFDEQDTDSDENVEPSESDDDYKHNDSASASDTYYVQFFAVGVAFDGSSLSNAYSLVLDLGSVPIIKNK